MSSILKCCHVITLFCFPQLGSLQHCDLKRVHRCPFQHPKQLIDKEKQTFSARKRIILKIWSTNLIENAFDVATKEMFAVS